MEQADFNPTISQEHLDVLQAKASFVAAISEAVSWNCGSIASVCYEAYQEEGYDEPMEFVVVTYRGGAIAVRNVHMNSHSAILMDIAKLADGGYYKEVEGYKKILSDPKIHKIVG